MIYILADEVRTGKTSALLEWIETWDEVRGVLCPDGKNGKRYLLDLESRKEFPLEVDEPNDKTISVGKFHFAKPSFELANYILKKAFDEAEYEFLVVDELGKLELENEGIHAAADHIFKNYKPSEDQHIMTVVRTSLVKEILKKYNIRDFQIVSKEFLLDV
jgi:nucleoside-triphosphatase